MIEQSLCHHLQTQLTEYYRLIAILESQMATVPPTDDLGRANGIDDDRPREEETGLTLKRLDVWIEDWRLRMRMMSVCVEGARGHLLLAALKTLLLTMRAQTHMEARWSTSSMAMRRMATHLSACSQTSCSKRSAYFCPRRVTISPGLRFQNRSSPSCTIGYSPGSYTTRFQNSLSLSTRN